LNDVENAYDSTNQHLLPFDKKTLDDYRIKIVLKQTLVKPREI